MSSDSDDSDSESIKSLTSDSSRASSSSSGSVCSASEEEEGGRVDLQQFVDKSPSRSRKRSRKQSTDRRPFQRVVEEDYSPPPSRSYRKRSDKSPEGKRQKQQSGSRRHSAARKKCAATYCAVKENAPLLELLVRANEEERKCLIKHIDDDGLDIVCCCVFNAIWNKDLVPQRRRELINDRLGEFRQPLIYLSRHRNNNRKKRRELLVQHGAGLPLLLSSVLPAIKAATVDLTEAAEPGNESKRPKRRNKKKKKNNRQEGEVAAVDGETSST